jgi:inhibitor of cysteine peptidase
VAVAALVFAVAGTALVGCDSAKDDGAGTTVALTQADDGKSYTVGVGDTITVELEGNPTTGYAWASDLSAEDAALLTLVGGEPAYAGEETGSDVVGAGGTYTFTFTADSAGQLELKLKYWRSFEPDTEPIETFSVDLTIE